METNTIGLSLEFIIHPGETLKELIEENNMSQEELAQRTNFSAKHISQVINGKKRITAQFAKSLEYVFGINTTFWLNLQAIYDREIIDYKERNDITSKEIEIAKKIEPILKYSNSLKLIDKYTNDIERVIIARNFCKITNLQNIEKVLKLQIAYKKNNKNVDEYMLYAWQRMCELIANKEELKNKYDKEVLLENIKKIKRVLNENNNKILIEKVKKYLEDSGIIFVLAKKFKGVEISGFIEKNNEKIILCMADRRKIDNDFWFVLFHELSHILNEDIEGNRLEYYLEYADKEQKADAMAFDFLK